MSEPTIKDVQAAVARLPHDDLVELAKGPLDTGDADECRICALYDDYVYGYGGDVPHADAILTLIDYHRFYGSPSRDGRGAEAWRRCIVIYQLAANALGLEAQHRPQDRDPRQDEVRRDVPVRERAPVIHLPPETMR